MLQIPLGLHLAAALAGLKWTQIGETLLCPGLYRYHCSRFCHFWAPAHRVRARHAHNMASEVINNTKQFIRPADLKSVIKHRFSARNEGLKTQNLMGKCGQGGDGWPFKQYRHC